MADLVFCLSSTKWPVEATEWTKRKKPLHWPTQEVFDNMINTGYYLAAVGCKES